MKDETKNTETNATRTIKTRLHAYEFNIGNPEEYKAYNALHESLRRTNGKCFDVIRTGPACGVPNVKDGDVVEIELETKHLFDNQWNTAPCLGSDNGLRVFDWYEGITYVNGRKGSYRAGHWLDITDEMVVERANRVKCGWCGAQYQNGQGVFCTRCIDGPYLKESDLHLLRLRPVAVADYSFPPLTDEERAVLVPLYAERQVVSQRARKAEYQLKERAELETKRAKAIDKAEKEYAGKLWLWEHGINLDNVIYYDHTGVFCFGWRTPVSDSVRAHLVEVLAEFPGDYEIK